MNGKTQTILVGSESLTKLAGLKVSVLREKLVALTKELFSDGDHTLELRVGGISPVDATSVGYYCDLFHGMPWLVYRKSTTAYLPTDGLGAGMTIHVKGLSDFTEGSFDVTCDTRVHGVMTAIRQRWGIEERQQRLVFHSRALDPWAMLCDYNIQRDDTLHLVLNLRGGGTDVSFVDMAKGKMKEQKWSAKANPWRCVRYGLSLVGECTNAECVASGQDVIVNRGMGTTDIVQGVFRCPMCTGIIKPRLPGFNNTRWRFCGQKADGSFFPWSIWREAGNCFNHMDEKECGQASWKKLMIEASDLEVKHVECSVCLEPANPRVYSCGHAVHDECKDTTGACVSCLLPLEKLKVTTGPDAEPDWDNVSVWDAYSLDHTAVSEGTSHVVLKPLDRERVMVTVKHTDTVGTLRELAAKKTGAPAKDLCFVHAGRQWQDDNATLTSLGVGCTGNTIHVLLRTSPTFSSRS